VGPVVTLIVVFQRSLVATLHSTVLSPSSILAAAHFPSFTIAAYKPSEAFAFSSPALQIKDTKRDFWPSGTPSRVSRFCSSRR